MTKWNDPIPNDVTDFLEISDASYISIWRQAIYDRIIALLNGTIVPNTVLSVPSTFPGTIDVNSATISTKRNPNIIFPAIDSSPLDPMAFQASALNNLQPYLHSGVLGPDFSALLNIFFRTFPWEITDPTAPVPQHLYTRTLPISPQIDSFTIADFIANNQLPVFVNSIISGGTQSLTPFYQATMIDTDTYSGYVARAQGGGWNPVINNNNPFYEQNPNEYFIKFGLINYPFILANFGSPQVGDYALDIWRRLQVCVNLLLNYYIQITDKSGNIVDRDFDDYIATGNFRQTNPTYQFTRMYPREIGESDLGFGPSNAKHNPNPVEGQLARYIPTQASSGSSDSAVNRHSARLHPCQIYRYTGGKYKITKELQPDLIITQGLIQAGDYFGPWILDDLRSAIKLLRWTPEFPEYKGVTTCKTVPLIPDVAHGLASKPQAEQNRNFNFDTTKAVQTLPAGLIGSYTDDFITYAKQFNPSTLQPDMVPGGQNYFSTTNAIMQYGSTGQFTISRPEFVNITNTPYIYARFIGNGLRMFGTSDPFDSTKSLYFNALDKTLNYDIFPNWPDNLHERLLYSSIDSNGDLVQGQNINGPIGPGVGYYVGNAQYYFESLSFIDWKFQYA